MFQNNIYSGFLFLIGIFYNSWLLGIAAILGTSISTLVAHILNYSKEDIKDGLYGFNGTLVGIALWYFFGFTISTFLVLIIGAALTAPLNYYLKKIIPPFTAPFIIVTWIMIYVLLVFNLPLSSSLMPAENVFDLLASSAKSFGQVMFQENSITGVFFLLSIVVNSKLSAVYAIYAAVLGSLIGFLVKEPILSVNAGLMGYNAVLCAVALTDKKPSTFVWVSLAVIVSVLLNIGLGKIGILILTAPFVLTTWGILVLKHYENKWRQNEALKD